MADQRARLQGIVHARFCEVFGKPNTTRGLDAHWSIALDGFDKPPIHVLVNGAPETPAVWVFDPHVRNSPVHNAVVTDEHDLHRVIKHIEHRRERAAASMKASGTTVTPPEDTAT